MFQKLRKKFIFIAMFSVTVVLIGIVSFINITYYLQINRNADKVIDYITYNGGKFPENGTSYSYGNRDNPLSGETPYRTRFFTVTFNELDDVTSINLGHVVAILPSEAYNYALSVMGSNKKSGYFGNYKFKVTKIQNGELIVFLDMDQELENLSYLVISSVAVALGSFFVILLLISFLSKPIIEPIIQNALKQRQFITDASHELKTPLSIISADADVIEILHGKDEWTVSIKEQIQRLTKLIQDMLTLSRMDADIPANSITQFNISDIIQTTAEEFKPIAINEQKDFIINIEPEIQFSGNMEGVKQLISVLLNNAFKYTDDRGKIDLEVKRKGKSTVIELSNTTDTVPEGDLKRLFDRFYRADSSRSRETGSYGIGLSIAQAISQQHKGNINAIKLNDHEILFKAVLNNL